MRKICVSAFGLFLCAALAAPSPGLSAGDPVSASKGKRKEHGHRHQRPCRHGYVRKHGKCRSTRVEEIVSGEWSGPYTHVKVDAQARTMSIELNDFPCDDPHGSFALRTDGGPVTGSISKIAVGAKATASGSYSESDPYGSKSYKWELTGTFATRTNFSGLLHIVVEETVTSPNSAPSHCDQNAHYELGYIDQ